MRLRTAQIAKWRQVKELGLEITDTTVKSAFFGPFSPDWSYVKQYKDGVISEEEYTALYTDKMRLSYKHRQAEWLDFIQKEDAVIGCYCSPGAFCHRLLLVDMLRKVCEAHNVPFCYMGEIP